MSECLEGSQTKETMILRLEVEIAIAVDSRGRPTWDNKSLLSEFPRLPLPILEGR